MTRREWWAQATEGGAIGIVLALALMLARAVWG